MTAATTAVSATTAIHPFGVVTESDLSSSSGLASRLSADWRNGLVIVSAPRPTFRSRAATPSGRAQVRDGR